MRSGRVLQTSAHIDVVRSDIDRDYRRRVELTGDIAATFHALGGTLGPKPAVDGGLLETIARDRAQFAECATGMNGISVHPMRLVHELQRNLGEEMTICLDIGSFHIWLARYLDRYRALCARKWTVRGRPPGGLPLGDRSAGSAHPLAASDTPLKSG